MKLPPNDVTGARSILFEMCRARLAKTRGTSWRSKSLVEFVHEASSGDLDAPEHLRVYCEAIQDAPGKALRLCFHAPPQHSKTESTLHAFLWWDLHHPGLHHAYVTYNADQAKEVAQRFRIIAESAGFDPSGTLTRIRLKNGSVVRFSSIGGSLTGKKVDGVFVIDDPFRNFEDAHSVTKRRTAVNWFKSVALTRRHKTTSFIVMATRWHRQDLTGHLVDKEGWQYVCLKAIAEGPVNDNGVVIDDPNGRQLGEVLWPEFRPADFFEEDRRDPYIFSAMHQGDPVPEGNRKFHEPGDIDADGNPVGPRYYSSLPAGGHRIAFGVDLAYTEAKVADWSVLIEGWEHGGNIYIVDVKRGKVTADRFAEILRDKQKERPRAKFRWYASTTEKGMAALFRSRRFGIVGFKALLAQGSKLVRATPASIAWNAGEILLPDPELIEAPWLEPFLQVVCNFTGNDTEDDDVDALAALYDELNPHRGGLLAALRR